MTRLNYQLEQTRTEGQEARQLAVSLLLNCYSQHIVHGNSHGLL